MQWLAAAFYPQRIHLPRRNIADFYRLFFGVTPTAAQLEHLLAATAAATPATHHHH